MEINNPDLVQNLLKKRIVKLLGKDNDPRSKEDLLIDEDKLKTEIADYKKENPPQPQLVLYPPFKGRIKAIFTSSEGSSKEGILTYDSNEVRLLSKLDKNKNKPFTASELGDFLKNPRNGVDFTKPKRRGLDTKNSLIKKFGPDIIKTTPKGFVFNTNTRFVSKLPH